MLETTQRYIGRTIENIFYPGSKNLDNIRLLELDYYNLGISHSERIIKKAAQTGEIDLIIYDISFNQFEKDLKYNKLISKIDQIFKTLDEDLTLNTNYIHVIANNELRNTITDITLNDIIYKKQIYDLHESLKTLLDENELKEHSEKDNEKCVIAKFDNNIHNWDSTTAASIKPQSDLNYSLITTEADGYKFNLNEIAQLTCHELAHKIGIKDISDTKSPDIMSNGTLAHLILYLTKETKFGPESRHLWNNIKERHQA